MTDSSAQELELTISGLVQGVYFRASVAEWARTMDFTGFARNNPDGSVTVLAQGARPVLELLISKCYNDIRRARVDNITAQWRTISRRHATFVII